MQPFSLGASAWLAQAPAPGALQNFSISLHALADRLAPYWIPLALLFVLGELLRMVSIWLAAKPLTEEEDGRFVNAFKVWGLYLLFTLGLLVAIGIFGFKSLLPYLASQGKTLPREGMTVAFVILGISTVVMLVAVFAVPMRIYKFGFGSACLFILLGLITNLIFSFGLQLAFSRPLRGVQDEVVAWSRSLAPGGPPLPTGPSKGALARTFDPLEKRASDKSKTPKERQQALQEIYTELEKYRLTLNTGNLEGVAEYERRKARYEQILADLKAEVAAARR